MTTIHRILTDKVVIEDDRRVKSGKLWGRRNALPKHDYSQKQKIIYIPMDPQPKAMADNYFHYGNIVCSLSALESEYSPFQPSDTLILLEKWVNCDFNGYFLLTDITTRKLVGGSAPKPASAMPPELDSQCKQFTVAKVLSIEDLDKEQLVSTYDWYWKLLTKEK